MFIVVQIPLVDLRLFLSRATGRLRAPFWRAPDLASPEFVRGFGVMRKRIKGEIYGIPGDVFYADAHRALRFEGATVPANCASGPWLRPVYRRLFCDGRACARVELAFALSTDLPLPKLLEAIQHQLTLPVRIAQSNVKSARKEIRVALGQSGRALATAYLQASTAHEIGEVIGSKWIVAGEPAVFVERGALTDDPGEATDGVPVSVLFQPGALPGANTVEKQAASELTLSLSRHLVVAAGQTIVTWVATAGSGMFDRERRAAGRVVRGHVLRIHAEIESFKAVLRAISQQVLAADGTIPPDLDRYLRDAAKLLLSESKGGFNRGFVLSDLEKSTHQLPMVDRAALELTISSLPSLSAGTRQWLDSLLASPRVPNGGSAAPAPATALASPLILFMAANPLDTDRLQLGKEARSIELSIRQREPRLPLRLETHWAVRVDDLIQAIVEKEPMILHFSGHGDEAGLSFETDGDAPQNVDGRALAAFLGARERRVTLVVLNACYSVEQAKAIAEVVDYVIAMKTAISDDAAIVYASTLYRTLCFDPTIRNAHRVACAALQLHGLHDEGSTPVLLIRDGVLAGALH